MKVIKLDSSHIDATRHLFDNATYMSSTVNIFFADPTKERSDFYHEAFHTTYLSGLKKYHAFGYIDDDGKIQGFMSFYQSTDDSSWYCTNIRNGGDKNTIRAILDEVIKFNEAEGLFKFYTLANVEHAKLLRRWTFSPWANERYGYVDEYTVPAKTQCKYNLHWQILFNRVLIPVDTVVRCTYLKQEYRTQLPVAGNL